MNTFTNIFKGLFIGSGAILPGISSGVLCVILGIYEKLLNSVLDFFKAPKESLLSNITKATPNKIENIVYNKYLNLNLFFLLTSLIKLGMLAKIRPYE